MKIPRYWAKEQEEVRAPGRKKNFSLECWGWSDRSQEEARGKAFERLRGAAAKVLSGAPLARYPYGRAPLREPVIEVLAGKRGEDSAVVTRNAYGALVLNTATAMFMDVDLPAEKTGSGLSRFFGRLLGRVEQPAENHEARTLERIEGWAERQHGLSVRVYRTAAGFRCLVTSHAYEPASGKALEMMTSLGCDPLYVRLCKDQGSFRARLTPKPWRVHVANPPSRWPFRDDRAQRKFLKWEEKYRSASSAWCVCRLVKELGGAKIHPEIAPVLALHDRMCCSQENNQKLA